MTPAVQVEGLGKRYRQYRDGGPGLRSLLSRGRRSVGELWALRGLDFEVERGGTLGIIGRNGSGKTTLLRLLSGVSAPTEGRLQVVGRIAPMIGIGVGFNRELTGRENVRVNGRLLGMSAEEVDDRYGEIVDFAQLAEHIDTPVKFYSSGMFLRLAFSVAVHTDPDVMLVDEILAVGDVAFQTRSFERMRALQEAGTTVLVVTHNLQVLQQLTARTLVLDRGRAAFDGDTEEALAVYHRVLQDEDAGSVPTGGLRIEDAARLEVRLEDAEGRPTSQVQQRRPMQVRVRVDFHEEVVDPVVVVIVELPGLGHLFATGNAPRGRSHVHGPGRPLEAVVRLGEVPLLPQTYAVRAQLRSDRQETIHAVSSPVMFHVTGEETGHGAVAFSPSIELGGEPVDVVRLSLR